MSLWFSLPRSPIRLICQALLLLSLLELPATAAQIWVGAGRITEGIGQGGLVELQLKTERNGVQEGELVKTLHGLPLTGRIQAGAVRNRVGYWRFRPCARNLCVTLIRTNSGQTIVYRLHRSDREQAE